MLNLKFLVGPKIRKLGHVTPSRSVSRGSVVTPLFKFLDRDLHIHYVTFGGTMMTIKVTVDRYTEMVASKEKK